MALPVDPKTPWPPKDQTEILRDVDEAAAWYSDDTARLENYYGGANTGADTRSKSWVRFWARRAADRSNTSLQRLHVPAASDIAATSADLLFGDEPAITIPEAHQANPDTAAVDTEAHLESLLGRDNTIAKLLEAAEIAAALGGVYLRPVWDQTVTDHPMLTVVHADCAVPEFRWGQLVAVTFWQVVGGDRDHVLRHLERHEPGRIIHGLYEGGKDTLGVRIPLDRSPATADLTVNEDGEVADLPAQITGLVPRYVPNVLPNRKHRGQPVGRPDCQGTEPLMDALDETWTSWMRDIRLGKRRIVVPDQFLERQGRGKGAKFDVDQEVFTPLEMDPAHADRAGIQPIDFDIRTEQHASTCLALFEKIVNAAGYSGSTFGLADGAEVTATEYRGKERKTMRTRAKKARYLLPAVEEVLHTMLILDREVFGAKVEPFRPKVELAEQGDDPKARAETLELFTRAQAMSVETRVRWAQPNLDEAGVAAEVQRIMAEQGMSVSDPTGGLGADGGSVDQVA